jgi:hypothetical protein
MENKPKLFNRYLECGHERATSIKFLVGNYEEPEQGEYCYCRECRKESKIKLVSEFGTSDIEDELKENKELFSQKTSNTNNG